MSGDLRHEVRALRAENAQLRAQLALVGVEPASTPRWAADLQPTQVALLGALLEVHPRWLDPYTLEEVTRPDHAAERSVNTVSVLVCRLRARFGEGCIETVKGSGYRLSDAFAARLREA